MDKEAERRIRLQEVFCELKGEIALDSFTLSARADRIERLSEGGIAILDYKTGAPPKEKDIEGGLAPQLPLEAAMAARGAFADIGEARAEALLFWRLTGGKEVGKEQAVKGTPSELADQAIEGLRALIDAFADPATSYNAVPSAGRQPRFNDYAHLERLQEWSLAPSEDQ